MITQEGILFWLMLGIALGLHLFIESALAYLVAFILAISAGILYAYGKKWREE